MVTENEEEGWESRVEDDEIGVGGSLSGSGSALGGLRLAELGVLELELAEGGEGEDESAEKTEGLLVKDKEQSLAAVNWLCSTSAT